MRKVLEHAFFAVFFAGMAGFYAFVLAGGLDDDDHGWLEFSLAVLIICMSLGIVLIRIAELRLACDQILKGDK